MLSHLELITTLVLCYLFLHWISPRFLIIYASPSVLIALPHSNISHSSECLFDLRELLLLLKSFIEVECFAWEDRAKICMLSPLLCPFKVCFFTSALGYVSMRRFHKLFDNWLDLGIVSTGCCWPRWLSFWSHVELWWVELWALYINVVVTNLVTEWSYVRGFRIR